jgi:RNA polymerase sporulation-specific sigma factor
MQIGTIGMIKAIRSFDMERGTAFSTYAVPLIIGEIRRHLRDDGLIRVSRGYKRTGIAIMREKNRIMTEEGREAGVGELAGSIGVSVEEAAIAIDAVSPISSLSDNVFGEDSKTLDSVIPDREAADELENLNDRISLGQAINKMPQEWRKIVLLRYYRDMTQQEVANLLGLSQVKVSREEKKIMSFLRGELA